jgi:hypothetical protein
MVREKKARRHAKGSIWDTPRIKKILAEPVGAPIDLTPEEALAIARASFGRGKGRWPDGAEYVKQVRSVWRGLLKRRDG